MGRTLVIRGGAVGDFILTLPVLDALRLAHPSDEIYLLGYPEIAEIAVGRRYADAVGRVDAVEWAPLFSPGARLEEKEVRFLRSFDRIVCIWKDEDAVLCENLRLASGRPVLHLDPIPPPSARIHAVDFIAEQCTRAGLRLTNRRPRIFPAPRDTWWAERFMRVTGAGRGPLLGMHPGSGSPAKNWPVSKFVSLAEYWIRSRDGRVLVTMGPAEEGLAGAFDGARGREDHIFVLRNEAMPKVAACLERCDAFVGNDSGITHMAAAVGTRTLALFGPTDPAVWGPRGERVSVIVPESGREMAGIRLRSVISSLEELVGSRTP